MTSTRLPESVIPVTIDVPAEHPLLLLKEELPLEELENSARGYWRKAGKNVDGGPGRPFDYRLWVRIIILMLFLKKDYRQMERELKENVVARLFVKFEESDSNSLRDHSNIARACEALGAEGTEELNVMLLQKALTEGFTDRSVLSSDTTAQEVHITYPSEAGILRQVAQRVARLCKALKKSTKEGVKDFVQSSKELLELLEVNIKTILKKVKEHQLFAKGKEAKTKVLEQVSKEAQELMSSMGQLVHKSKEFACKSIEKMCANFENMEDFLKRLLPQVRHWLDTGKVAKDKLIHPGIQEARALIRNKAGKKVEFGFKWLINLIKGGYTFGSMFFGAVGESTMPVEAIDSFQRNLVTDDVPKLFAYDRGGWSKKNGELLQKRGVEKVGIQPKGQADWLIEEADQDTVKSLRAQTEGIIGTLKNGGYRFNKPKERSTRTIEQAGQRAFVSKNLNKLLSDLLKKRSKA